MHVNDQLKSEKLLQMNVREKQKSIVLQRTR